MDICGYFKLSSSNCRIEECTEDISKSECEKDCLFFDKILDCSNTKIIWGMKEFDKSLVNYLSNNDILFLQLLGEGFLFIRNDEIFYRRDADSRECIIPSIWGIFQTARSHFIKDEIYSVKELIIDYQILMNNKCTKEE